MRTLLKRFFYCTLLLTAFCSFSFGQTVFQWLIPGKSTKADVEQRLGAPVSKVSETLYEYGSQWTGIEKIYVQFQKDSGAAARIEVLYKTPVSVSSLREIYKLPQTTDTTGVNDKGKLLECYGAGKYIILTHDSVDSASGISRVGFFTDDLFNIAKTNLKPAPSGSSSSPPENLPTGMKKPQLSSGNDSSGSATLSQYNALMTQAWQSLQAYDYTQAIRIAQQGVQMNASQPRAYEILGMAYVYGLRDSNSGVNAMSAAIDHGGEALFGVTHDHDGLFTAYCAGNLSLSKSGIAYRANYGSDSFQASVADIVEAKPNDFVGSNWNSFHIKISQNGKLKNYNFAPTTVTPQERDVILALIQKVISTQ